MAGHLPCAESAHAGGDRFPSFEAPKLAIASAAPTVSATTAGNDLHITYNTHVRNPAGLVVTAGDMTSKGPLCELAMDEQREVPESLGAASGSARPGGAETVPGIAFSQSSPSVSMSRSSR